MLLSEHEESPVRHAERLCELFIAGTEVLNDMFQNKVALTFHAWSARLGKTAEVEETLRSGAQRKWLWDAIRTEPSFKRRFGELPAATTSWTSRGQRFLVFHAGAQFEILMAKTTVSIRTEEPLDMKPGKGGRLECCDCKALVTIRADEIFPTQREADIMRIPLDRISVNDGVLVVKADSLNQAFTVSSRRLEPKRRSHGGRTYDYVIHVAGTTRTRLEDIRRAVENGTWKTPTLLNNPAAENTNRAAG